MQTLVSIQIGKPRDMEADPTLPLSSKPWRTAIFKKPIVDDVTVEPEGILGDGQADLKNHGGFDKAICVYPVEHFSFWQERLNRTDVSFGAFGENFTVAGMNESSVAIGDRWKIGDAVFEVSQPRQPCWKLARRWHTKSLAVQAIDTGKTGWYLRVIQPGKVRNDSPIIVSSVTADNHVRFSIAQANHLFYQKNPDVNIIRKFLEVPQLSQAWRSELKKRLTSA